jgi:glutathione synthase
MKTTAKKQVKKKKRSFLWITDPWNTLDHPKDTTLRLMQEGLERGHPQFWCDVKSLRMENDKTRLDASQLISVDSDRHVTSFEWAEIETCLPSDFHLIHYRTDPPVDLAYLHPLQCLALSLRGKKTTQVVNPIEVLCIANEKLEAAALRDLMPTSIVSSQWERLREFGKKHQRTVLKPLHQAQSQGIELLDWRTEDGCHDANLKLDAATQHFQTPVILQVYLEGIAQGETRLWFLDGKLLAHAKKLPLSGDFRVNIDRGSQLKAMTLSRQEKLKVPKIAKHLRDRKIRLAAVDLIEGYITDFNFTSPGLITQMEAILKENLARSIIDALAK